MTGYTLKKRGKFTLSKTFSLSLAAVEKITLLAKRSRNISTAVSNLIERCVSDDGEIVAGNVSAKQILFDKFGDLNPEIGELSDSEVFRACEGLNRVWLAREKARIKTMSETADKVALQ